MQDALSLLSRTLYTWDSDFFFANLCTHTHTQPSCGFLKTSSIVDEVAVVTNAAPVSPSSYSVAVCRQGLICHPPPLLSLSILYFFAASKADMRERYRESWKTSPRGGEYNPLSLVLPPFNLFEIYFYLFLFLSHIAFGKPNFLSPLV